MLKKKSGVSFEIKLGFQNYRLFSRKAAVSQWHYSIIKSNSSLLDTGFVYNIFFGTKWNKI